MCVLGVPCFGCEDTEKCNTKLPTNPEECLKLTGWIYENIGVEPVKQAPPPESAGDGLFVCPVCGKEIPSERGMKIHLTRVHKPKS